jgi:hypothetical protein
VRLVRAEKVEGILPVKRL